MLQESGNSCAVEAIDKNMLVRLARLQYHRWEIRLVDSIWEALCLQAEPAVLHVAAPVFPLHSIQEIASVELHRWRSGLHIHATATCRVEYTSCKLWACRVHAILDNKPSKRPHAVQDVVMVIAPRKRGDMQANVLLRCEIQWSASDRKYLASCNHVLSKRSVMIPIYFQDVVQHIAGLVTRKVEVAMLCQIDCTQSISVS
mmetsp:Transcript_6534/g.18220  ORF Transcript_6534/g.18220 Transcript_6534/m.18220 type:complete len:201 (-) Transcript_6534:92-694(-)